MIAVLPSTEPQVLDCATVTAGGGCAALVRAACLADADEGVGTTADTADGGGCAALATESGRATAWAVVEHRPMLHMSIGEAVRRAGNSERYTGSKNRQTIKTWVYNLAKAARGEQIHPVEFRRKLYVPPSLHPALSEPARPERVSADSVKSLSEGRRNKAAAKVRAINDCERYGRHSEGRALGRVAALARFVEAQADVYRYRADGVEQVLKLSVRSLERWRRQYRDGGVDALSKDGRGGSDREGPAEEAAAFYWSLRMDKRRFSMATCWRLTSVEAERHGWTWFKEYATCAAWDRRTRDDRALVLNQRGSLEYTRRCGQYVEQDPESFEPGECWVGDDSSLDLWVKLPSGEVVRPVLSTWLDWRSRAIVGYRVVTTGNEHSLLLGFSDGAREFGLPWRIIADNGKGFVSWQWQGGRPLRRVYMKGEDLAERADGLFALCGITPSWALPYNPNGKARLERVFGTVEDQFIRAFESYCGDTPDNRPEAHAKLIEKAVEWAAFVAALRHYIDTYNNTPHSGEGMDGLTPLQVMAQRTRKRCVPEGVHDLLLAAWQRPVSIGRNGVAIHVAGSALRYGQFAPELNALNPKTQVRVSYDPQDLSSIVVWTMDYRFICRAELNRKHNRSVASEELRETMRQMAREKRRLREAYQVGLNHLRDPVDRTISALEQDAQRRRKPDPASPDGGPLLVPVQTPIEAPSNDRAALRKVACGEGIADMTRRFEECARDGQDQPRSAEADAHVAFARWAKREAVHA